MVASSASLRAPGSAFHPQINTLYSDCTYKSGASFWASTEAGKVSLQTRLQVRREEEEPLRLVNSYIPFIKEGEKEF